ncbi:unnamed protein product [Didymodactylos carnosus]|uniref:Uncharacterized protein n=1 Tax=Didymodactylos carnosus TaxID=1234261 RepID=A0A815WSV6_9BILA|nr:unnamed protein product [Didymodactylos carnosus]CAF4410193.1 unnamed protein product [Didymodactylos carnosus]
MSAFMPTVYSTSSDQHDSNSEMIDLQTSCSSLTEQNLQLVAEINLSKIELKRFVDDLKSSSSFDDKILLPSDPPYLIFIIWFNVVIKMKKNRRLS